MKNKLYMPSNGSEGDCFINKWCANCRNDSTFRIENGNTICDILTRSFIKHNVKQWVYINNIPTCTSFVFYKTYMFFVKQIINNIFFYIKIIKLKPMIT